MARNNLPNKREYTSNNLVFKWVNNGVKTMGCTEENGWKEKLKIDMRYKRKAIEVDRFQI